MKGLIEAALGRPRQSQKTPDRIDDSLISVVGVGGAGNNALKRLHEMGIKSARTIAINTDRQHLDVTTSSEKVLIGEKITRGLGAGGYPKIGKKAAEADKEKIAKALDGSELVFIAAGMGGGTGTGAAPVVAEIANQLGALTVAVVTFPFRMEKARLDKAAEGIGVLRQKTDTLIVVDNNKLLEYVPNLPINEAFSAADEIIARAIKGISDTIRLPSLVNIDFADVRAVMGKGDVAVISVGEASGADKSRIAVQEALTHPLLEVDYDGATGALVHVSGGSGMTLAEIAEIGENMTRAIDPSAPVYWGARVQPELEDRVVVTVILTGVHSPQILGKSKQTLLPQKQVATERKLGDALEEISYV